MEYPGDACSNRRQELLSPFCTFRGLGGESTKFCGVNVVLVLQDDLRRGEYCHRGVSQREIVEPVKELEPVRR